MQTKRDGEIVDWLGRIGAGSVDHVSERFNMRPKAAYARLATLTRDGLLIRQNLLHARPGLYVATQTGLRWQGLSRLGIVRLNPGSFEHAWQVASAAVALERELPDWQILGEREFRALERDEGELIASARVGRAGPRPMFHHPDLAAVSPSGRAVAVEVELSVKSAARLIKICRDWGRARHLGHVYYLSAPAATTRAVRRAIETAKVGDAVTVLALEGVAALAARERTAGCTDNPYIHVRNRPTTR